MIFGGIFFVAIFFQGEAVQRRPLDFAAQPCDFCPPPYI